MRRSKVPFVKPTIRNGRLYEYFDTGAVDENGRKIRKRLPGREDPSFWEVYASLMAGRTRRANVAIELTLPKLVALYENSPEYRKLAPATQRSYAVYLAKIADQLSIAPARQLARKDVMLLRDKMAAKTGAANGMIRTLRVLYKWGRSREYVDHDPCNGIELFESEDYEPWPDALLAAALASDQPTIALPVALMYFTAQRIGDVCALRWSDVRDGYVYVTQQKTKKEMEIRLHKDLAQILAVTKRSGMTILANPKGRAAMPGSLREKLQRWAGERGFQVVPHGLRKNAVNALLEAGCSVAETASVTGQSLGMVEHYAKRRNTRVLSSAAILKMEGTKA